MTTDPVQVRVLRPDTGDARSAPCTQCGTSTPDYMFTDCCGSPMCDNCRPTHEWCACRVCDGRGFYEEYDPVVGRMLQWPCAACRQTGIAP